MWRLVSDGFASLQEIETHYSLVDVVTANTILDLKAWADYHAQRKPKT